MIIILYGKKVNQKSSPRSKKDDFARSLVKVPDG